MHGAYYIVLPFETRMGLSVVKGLPSSPCALFCYFLLIQLLTKKKKIDLKYLVPENT